MQGPMQLNSPRQRHEKTPKPFACSARAVFYHLFDRQLRVLLDVTIHDFPCIDLSLDYQDATLRLGHLSQFC